MLHILLDTSTNIYISEPIYYEILGKKKSPHERSRIYRKRNPVKFAGKVISKRGKRIYNGLSKIQKFMGGKQKEKWEKQVREKETPTFTISLARARALARLFSFWPCDEDSCFSTS